MKAWINKLVSKKKSESERVQTEQKIVTFHPDEKSEGEKVQEGEVRVEENVTENMSNKVGDEEDEDEYEEQIITCLVKMPELIRITKKNTELRGEYITLRHINKILCQEIINLKEICYFLLKKIGSTPPPTQNANHKNFLLFHKTNSNGLIYQYYSVRALLWKICIGYLPPSKNKWISILEGKLIQYEEFVRDYIIENITKKKGTIGLSDKKIQKKYTIDPLQSKENKKVSDHPLNREKQSKWKNFFEDNELWNLVEKDTIRTKPHCKFFQQQYEIELSIEDSQKHYQIERCEVHLSKIKNKTKTFYYDCLTRILYIYLKRHQDVAYCQGMNEVVSIIFYSYTNKNSQYFRRVSQSDTYFSFEIFMSLICTPTSNHFLHSEKNSKKFEEMLKRTDYRLYQILQQKNTLINLKIISIKWFNSLFLSEFEIDQSLILWDGFLAIASMQVQAKNNQNLQFDFKLNISQFMLYLGLALVHLNRSQLSEGENPLIIFAKIKLKAQLVLEKAVNLYKIFHNLFE